MPKTMQAKGLTAPEKATPKRAVKVAPEGIVTAIVAVTGVVDAVGDLIVPGAFTHTLTVRRPKVVDDHEWKNKVGRVLHVEEWLPGDPRLPKRTKDGKPWPAAAGALVATMQYNLNAERGRESYEWVRFYAESDEAEFSIGYKVPDGKARLRRDGVRVILMVDLFEFSHVLFGAAPLSMALEVKSLEVKSLGISAGSGGQVTTPALGSPDKEDPRKRKRREQREKTISGGPVDVEADDDADSMEYDEPPAFDPWREWDEDAGEEYLAQRAEDAQAPLRRAAKETKTASAALLEAKASGGWDRNEGNAENLRRWYVSGADGQIPWGAPGDFDACVAVASKHMSPENARGYCNLRHHDALGYYPATHAAMEGKQATAPKEVKAMSRMKGSYEERIAALHDAARELLETTMGEGIAVCPVATYDHEVVVTAYPHDGGERSFLIGYKMVDDADDAGDVELSEPMPVELSLVAEREDGDDGPAKAADDDVETVTVVGPMLSALENAAAVASTEGKAATAVREAAGRLFAGLAGKSAQEDSEDQIDGGADEAAEGDGDPEDAADGGADEATEVEPGDNHVTAETLPYGDWNSYRKTEPIEAMPMDKDFTVQTREGTVKGNAGDYLAVDSEGYPYPIAKDEMHAVYAKADPADPDEDGDPGASEDPASEQAESGNYDAEDAQDGGADEASEGEQTKADPADPDPEDAADGGAVKLNPDEHFSTMDQLDDPEDATDGGADEATEDDGDPEDQADGGADEAEEDDGKPKKS